MPTNKNAQLRYQILDRCFSNRHRKYSIYDLMDEVYEQSGERVSLRTIRDDITYMRYDMGAEIEAGVINGREQITNFALDRIKRVTSADIQFIKNTRYDFSSYFDDVVGVSVPNNPRDKETIILKFSPSRFPYVVSKPLHHSQQILDNDKCTLSIKVIPTRELEQHIFSFGADVEVLSPAPYRERIKKEIAENLKKYIVVQNDCTEDTDLCKKSKL